jgi:uncharacterized protein involved in outer membrane biogenesis
MLRSTIASQMASALERPVQIGSARAQVFPSPRITLSNVAIGGPQVLTAEQIIVGAGLRALFQRRVEDAVIRVRNGRIALDAGLTTPDARPARGAKSAPRTPRSTMRSHPSAYGNSVSTRPPASG